MRFVGKRFCVLVAGEPYRVIRCDDRFRGADGSPRDTCTDGVNRIIWVSRDLRGDLLAAELALAVAAAWRMEYEARERAASQMPSAERMDQWEKDLIKDDYVEAVAKILGEDGADGAACKNLKPGGVDYLRNSPLRLGPEPGQGSAGSPPAPGIGQSKPAEKKRVWERDKKLVAEAIRVIETLPTDQGGRMTCPYCRKQYKFALPMARHLHDWHEDEVVGVLAHSMIRDRLRLLQKSAKAAGQKQEPKI